MARPYKCVYLDKQWLAVRHRGAAAKMTDEAIRRLWLERRLRAVNSGIRRSQIIAWRLDNPFFSEDVLELYYGLLYRHRENYRQGRVNRHGDGRRDTAVDPRTQRSAEAQQAA